MAAFADQILGLRVAVKSTDGTLFFVNYEVSVYEAQVSIDFPNGQPNDGLTCVGQVFVIRNVNEFLDQFFHGSNSQNFPGGRVSRDSMSCDTFSNDAEALFKPSVSCILIKTLRPSQPSVVDFAKLFVAGAAVFVPATNESCRYTNMTNFLISAIATILKLRSIKSRLLNKANHFSDSSMTQQATYDMYYLAVKALAEHCLCKLHVHKAKATEEMATWQNYCSVDVVETFLVISCYLGCLSLEGEILPKCSGILKIYTDLNSDKTYSYLLQPRVFDS